MGRNPRSASKGRRSFTIQVNYQWVQDATRSILRAITLDALLREVISELPEDRQLYWRFRRRGVDATIRTMYYGPTLDKQHNETTQDQNPQESNGTSSDGS